MSKMLSLGHMYAAKLGARFLMPIFKNPIGQMVISFGVGYLVTTKLSKMYTEWKGNSSEFQTDDLLGKESLKKDDISLLGKDSEMILLTTKQLAAFDGKNPDQPVYAAINGVIYDLSPGREKFCNGGPYNILAGGNANEILQLASGYMDFCEHKLTNYLEQSLKAEFKVVGYLIDWDGGTNGNAADKKIDLKKSQTEDDLGEPLK